MLTGMNTRRGIRRIVLATVWGLAVSTWSAIGHHLFGLPDFGLPAVIVTMAGILLWPSAKSAQRALLPHSAPAK